MAKPHPVASCDRRRAGVAQDEDDAGGRPPTAGGDAAQSPSQPGWQSENELLGTRDEALPPQRAEQPAVRPRRAARLEAQAGEDPTRAGAAIGPDDEAAVPDRCADPQDGQLRRLTRGRVRRACRRHSRSGRRGGGRRQFGGRPGIADAQRRALEGVVATRRARRRAAVGQDGIELEDPRLPRAKRTEVERRHQCQRAVVDQPRFGGVTDLPNPHRHPAREQAAAGAGRVGNVVLPQRQLADFFAVIGDRDRAAGAIAGTDVARREDRHVGARVLEFEIAARDSRDRARRRGIAVAGSRGGDRDRPQGEREQDPDDPHHQNSLSAGPDSVAADVEIAFSARS
jgi:hypothetical protein